MTTMITTTGTTTAMPSCRWRKRWSGVVFVVNSFIITWIFADRANPIAAASAMIGAIILGYPIVWTAMDDLRRGLLTTNELVALAVLAAFGSACGRRDFESTATSRPASSLSSC